METQILNAVLNVGAMGLLTWVAMYWLPKMADRLGRAQEVVAVESSKVLVRAIEAFESEQRLERETCERRHKENMENWIQMMASIKETRHAVKNLDSSVAVAIGHIVKHSDPK